MSPHYWITKGNNSRSGSLKLNSRLTKMDIEAIHQMFPSGSDCGDLLESLWWQGDPVCPIADAMTWSVTGADTVLESEKSQAS